MNMITFVDDIMGSGKSTAMINRFNESKDESFIYVTPFLDEVDRIVEACEFRAPMSFTSQSGAYISKGIAFQFMLKEEGSLAITHSLLKNLALVDTDYSKYTLVLDEVMDLISVYDGLSYADVKWLEREGYVAIDEETQMIVLNGEAELAPDKFKNELKYLDKNCLYLAENKVVILEIPLDILYSFKDVIIMSYLVEGSVLFQQLSKSADIEKWMVNSDMTGFVEWSEEAARAKAVKAFELITLIEDDGKARNIIGRLNRECTWSVQGTVKLGEAGCKRVGKMLCNYFQSNKLLCDKVMVSSFGGSIKVPSYKKCHVAYNCRATNDYVAKDFLVYLISKHQNPCLQYWIDNKHDIEVDDEKYSLDCLLQWVFRSGIRKGNEVTLVLPSLKMRKVLIKWGEGKL